MIVTPEQFTALYAMRKTAALFDVRPVEHAADGTTYGLIATAPDGRAWLITPDGTALRYEEASA